MPKLDILAGATSVSVAMFIQDSSSTTGAGLTGLVYNTSGLTCYAVVPGASAAAVSLATLAAANSAWSSGGFKEIDATNMPGWYRFDIPNANIASGRSVGFHFKGATNMAPLPLEISLTAVNNQDGVRFGMTALPNAAAEAAGGLYTRGTGAGQIEQEDNGKISINVKQWLRGTIPAVAVTGVPIVDQKYILGTVLTEGGAGRLAAALIKLWDVASPVMTAASVNQTGDSFARLGAPAGASVSADIAAVKSDTGAIKLADVVRQATATAGAASSITLDAGASATNSIYNLNIITITSGTGAGQSRLISAYVGATQVASVTPNWTTNPDNTSVFSIAPFGSANVQRWNNSAIATPNVAGTPVVDIVDWLGSAPNALISGRVDSNVQAMANAVIAAATFAANAVNANALATDAVTEIAAGVFSRAFSAAYGSYTFDQLVAMMAVALLAKCSGMATVTGTFRNLADNADVIVATQDADGNRSAVTLTP